MNVRRLVLLAGMASLAIAQQSHAALLITLAHDGSGGVVATFQGSGLIAETSSSSTHGNLGDYVTVDLTMAAILPEVEIAPGISISAMTVDDDSAQVTPDDDLTLFLNQTVAAGTAYSVDESAFVSGISFSSLNPGTYVPEFGFGAFSDVTLRVVPVPAAAVLFCSAFGLVGLARRKTRGALGKV